VFGGDEEGYRGGCWVGVAVASPFIGLGGGECERVFLCYFITLSCRKMLKMLGGGC